MVAFWNFFPRLSGTPGRVRRRVRGRLGGRFPAVPGEKQPKRGNGDADDTSSYADNLSTHRNNLTRSSVGRIDLPSGLRGRSGNLLRASVVIRDLLVPPYVLDSENHVTLTIGNRQEGQPSVPVVMVAADFLQNSVYRVSRLLDALIRVLVIERIGQL